MYPPGLLLEIRVDDFLIIIPVRLVAEEQDAVPSLKDLVEFLVSDQTRHGRIGEIVGTGSKQALDPLGQTEILFIVATGDTDEFRHADGSEDRVDAGAIRIGAEEPDIIFFPVSGIFEIVFQRQREDLRGGCFEPGSSFVRVF